LTSPCPIGKIAVMFMQKRVLKTASLFILTALLFTAFPHSAGAEELKWSRVNLPADGQSGQWVLADGSDISCLTPASDGTLYCHANPSGTTYRLFKSADNGVNWSHTGKVEDTIVDIAVVPGQPNLVYYATALKIYKSTDAGLTFNIAANSPGGAGSGNISITSLEVTSAEGHIFMVMGTRDTDGGQYGGVYTLLESQSFDWVNTGIGNYDIYTVAFSPNFATDHQIVAAATDEVDTYISSGIFNGNWRQNVGDARITGITPVSAAIAFPADYNANPGLGKYIQFIAVNTGGGGGDVYRLRGMAAPGNSNITDLNAGSAQGLNSLDISSLAVNGNATQSFLIAGAAASAAVYFSADAGAIWSSSSKPPTGVSSTRVIPAPDFAFSGTAYAATSGVESAFSVSRDRGETWVQTSLIDTKILDIRDMAVPSGMAQSTTYFLVTTNVKDSLWYSFDGGTKWERIYCSSLPSVDRIDLVALSPQYSSNRALFLAGVSGGNPVIWKSLDNGKSWLKTASSDPKTQAAVNIDAWAITPEDIPIVGSFDGSNGVVYRNTGNGPYYSEKAVTGNQRVKFLALSPDYSCSF
jgi:hypothetical protein